MDATTATVTVLVGSAIFLVGAGIGVPRVFTEPDRAKKARMLDEQIVRWRVAQPLYAIGPLVAGTGVGLLAAEVGPGSPRIWIALSCLLLLAGALLWSWSVYLRGRRVREFALGELPGWPFASCVWPTLRGAGPRVSSTFPIPPARVRAYSVLSTISSASARPDR